MHYLLIARFSMDDIPLRLYGNRAMAEDAARAIDADPGLLKTKWARSLAAWPHGVSGGFVGMIVMSISESDGYPGQVPFDSTDYVPPDETAPPAKTTPPEPVHPPVPEGHIEITDPNHRLRSEIDYALDLADPKDGWSKVEKATVGDNSHKFRFCCPEEYHPSRKMAFAVLSPSGLPDGFVEITDPRHNVRVGIDYYADRGVEKGVLWKLVQESSGNLSGFRFACPADKHPDLQPAAVATTPQAKTDDLSYLRERNQILNSQQIALTDDIEILRRSNAELLAENNTLVATRTQLHKTISEMLEERSKWIETHVPELQGRYDQCKERVVDLEAQVWSLTSEKVSLSSKSEELQRNNVAYSRTNDELRALNEDLNHRLNATQARASRATELEGILRGTAQHLLGHFQELEERAKWSLRFADEGLLPAAYCKAMQHCQRRFAEEFEGFLLKYPHVLPDIPSEYWPVDDTDDEMND